MINKQLLFSFLFLIAGANIAIGQVSNIGKPIIFKNKIAKTKSFFSTPFVDNAQEIISVEELSTLTQEKIYRFGKEHSVSIDVFENAEKTVLPSGDNLYQFGIECSNAVSINLMFDKFELAQGVHVYLVDAVNLKYDGAYTFLNNNSSKMLGTELIYSDKVILEVFVPQDKIGLSELNIGTIIHGFRSLDEMAKSLNSSGSCEIDVNCPLGAGWEQQRNSVAMMVNGGGFCTGSLINNTSGTIIPYFISANHCGISPGAWVFRFRWESPVGQADCATSAPSIDGPSSMNVNGAVYCANSAASDFVLVLLNSSPDPSWGIYYNGWDRTDVPATQLTGIHHPAGDIKKISRDESDAISSAFNSGVANSHWRVPSWDQGVTEGGSSGSPLFNQYHRLVGQLHGGTSACGQPANNMNDDYGKFFLSWTGGGTDATRLSNWLDPGNIAPDFIDGVDPAVPTLALDGGVSNSFVNFGSLCGGTLTPQVDIFNPGLNTITTATIHYGFDGLTLLTYDFVGTVTSLQTHTITLPSLTLGEGSHTFKAIFENTTGTDLSALNDTSQYSFSTIVTGEVFILDLTINCYANENSWQVLDTLSQIVYVSGSGYDDLTPIPIIDSFCLVKGCYIFKLSDSYGDGLIGNASGCSDGHFTLSNSSDIVVVQLLASGANFGTIMTPQFCVGDAGLKELNINQEISLYPNPTSSVLIVSAENLKMESIDIMTITGQNVFSENYQSDIISLDVSSFEKGLYLMKISTLNGVILKQLIIQ